MHSNLLTSVVTGALLCVMPLGTAETSSQEPALTRATAAAKPLTLPKGEHSLNKVTDLVGDYLNLNILTEDLAAAPQRGSVTFKQDMLLEGDAALDVLSQLLLARGFVLTSLNPGARLLEVMDLQVRRGSYLERAQYRTAEEILGRPHLAMPVLVSTPLKHVDAQRATNSLRPFFAGNNSYGQLIIGTVGDANSLLMTGPQSVVADALRMVQLVDVPENQGSPTRLERMEKRLRDLEKRINALLGDDD